MTDLRFRHGESGRAFVFFIDAHLGGPFQDVGSPLAAQPPRVLFGPFSSPITLCGDTEDLRCEVAGLSVARFNPDLELWALDGMLFCKLTFGCVDSGEALSAGAVAADALSPMRYPSTFYDRDGRPVSESAARVELETRAPD